MPPCAETRQPLYLLGDFARLAEFFAALETGCDGFR
jgi:hypothetical protein